jgi:peptidoglycan/LPS O-acetylase OafA/YrhL
MPDQHLSIKTNKYPSLNGLRAISILIVVFYHLNLWHPIFPPAITRIYLILFDAQFGVNVFFVISGFLITRLLMKEEFMNKSISLKDFYIRRTLRIFPAYYFLLFIYFLMSCWGYIHLSKESWLTAITYTKYFNWKLDWYTAHAWSLSIEEQFYLFWPLIFMAGNKTRKIFIIIILLGVPLIRTIFYYYPVSWINYLTIFYRLDSIATGCLFALYQDEIIKKISPYFKKIFYASVFLLMILPFIKPSLNEQYHLHLGFLFIPFGNMYGTLANFIIVFIMMFSVFGPKNKWFNFLNSKVMNQIGVWSYSIYLWQEMFVYKTNLFINRFPLNILFIFIAALTSYYLIEIPFLKLKSRFSFGKRQSE